MDKNIVTNPPYVAQNDDEQSEHAIDEALGMSTSASGSMDVHDDDHSIHAPFSDDENVTEDPPTQDDDDTIARQVQNTQAAMANIRRRRRDDSGSVGRSSKKAKTSLADAILMLGM